MMEELRQLEEQIQKLLGIIRDLRQERDRLQSQVQSLQEEVAVLREVEQAHQRLQQERDEARVRIERILAQIREMEGSHALGSTLG